MENLLSEKRRYYRASWFTRGIMLFGGLMFLFFAALSYSSVGLGLSAGFGLFGLFALYLFVGMSRSVFISQSGIGTRWFWNEQFIRWENIGEVRHKNDNNLNLISTDQITVLRINEVLQNFGELVGILQQIRPDLWKVKILRLFHMKKGMFVFWLLIVAGCLALGIGMVIQNDSNAPLSAGLFFIGVGLVTLVLALRFPLSLELGNNELLTKSLSGVRRIPKDAVERLSIGEIARVNSVPMQGVTLWVRDPRKNKTTVVQFNNIKEGSAALYASLMDWGGFVHVQAPQPEPEEPRLRGKDYTDEGIRDDEG